MSAMARDSPVAIVERMSSGFAVTNEAHVRTTSTIRAYPRRIARP